MCKKKIVEANIRLLRHLIEKPCDCKATGHEASCRIGGLMMQMVADALEWSMTGKGPYQVIADKLLKEHLADCDEQIQAALDKPPRRKK